jgi:hypothetical protein
MSGGRPVFFVVAVSALWLTLACQPRQASRAAAWCCAKCTRFRAARAGADGRQVGRMRVGRTLRDLTVAISAAREEDAATEDAQRVRQPGFEARPRPETQGDNYYTSIENDG